MQSSEVDRPGPASSAKPAGRWSGGLQVALRHFLLAGSLYGAIGYLSLVLGSGPEGVAIFWPASGIAAGLVLGLGRPAHVPVGLATLVATVAVNFHLGRSAGLALAFGALNAGEALAVGWLMERVPERQLAFRRLIRVLALFVAAAAAVAIAATGALLAIQTHTSPSAPWNVIWQAWFLSDFVGIAVVAPLVVALIDQARMPDDKHEWTFDIALLLLFAFAAYHALSLRFDAGTWQAVAPGATLLPILVWLSARAQPVVPAVAVVLLAVMMAAFAASGSGRYGDDRLPLESRVLAAQVALVAVSLTALCISALFAERRAAEARLKVSEHRLALIADVAPGVIFSLARSAEGALRFPFVSTTSNEILGIGQSQLGRDAGALLARMEPADRQSLQQALAEPGGGRDILRLELPLDRDGASEIWLEINARSVAEADGSVMWHGFMHDVTTRHRLVEELNHRTRNLLTVVQAVAEHTARGTPPEQLADTLGERLAGLAASHQLLAARGWEGVELELLARSQLAHLGELFGDRLLIDGPALTLRPPAAQIIGMAIHELATNACKHGALSNDRGIARLAWIVDAGEAGGRLSMTWAETGGPPYVDTGRRGFGHKVVTHMTTYQLDADVTLEGTADGLIWRLSAPLASVVLSRPGTAA